MTLSQCSDFHIVYTIEILDGNIILSSSPNLLKLNSIYQAPCPNHSDKFHSTPLSINGCIVRTFDESAGVHNSEIPPGIIAIYKRRGALPDACTENIQLFLVVSTMLTLRDITLSRASVDATNRLFLAMGRFEDVQGVSSRASGVE